MSCPYSRASAVDSSEPNYSDGRVSVPSKSNRTAKKFSSVARPMGGWIHFPYGPTCEPSTEPHGAGASMSSPLDFHVSRSASPASGKEPTTSATDGLTRLGSLAKYDRATRSWRTCQGSLTPDTSDESSVTWPNSGTMRRGVCSPLEPLEHTTCAHESGFVPTPTKCDHKGSGRLRLERGANNNLRDWFKIRYRFLYPPVAVAEYLMGWPIGWTALAPLETDKFQLWSLEHGGRFRE